MKYDATLLDLPILPTVMGEDVPKIFVDELSAIKTPELLKKFTNRWQSVWRLPFHNEHGSLTEIQQSIVENTYNCEEALECIFGCKDGVCKHGKEDCVGKNIVIPPIFCKCVFIAQEFGVPTNVALIQLQSGLNNLSDDVADQVF